MSLSTKKMRQLREKLRMSQSEIADLIGISQSTYSDWESDKTIPNIKYWNKIAEVLQTDIAYLQEETNHTINNFFEENFTKNKDHSHTQELFQELLRSKDSEIQIHQKYITMLENQIDLLKNEIDNLREGSK